MLTIGIGIAIKIESEFHVVFSLSDFDPDTDRDFDGRLGWRASLGTAAGFNLWQQTESAG